jgi:steroid 5-alpha reductase family enzyme
MIGPIAPVLMLVLVAMTMVMAAAWAVQRAAGNGGWVDVFWTLGTGASCAAAALAPTGAAGGPYWRQVMVAAMVGLWALRLGIYVALRVARGSEDVRYAALRRAWGVAFQRNMLGLVLVQGPASALLAVAVVLAARNPHPGSRVADLLGLAIWLLAVVGEGAADGQMKRFKADPAHAGQVCDRGLWAWSRHPNYLFEFVGWLAYPVIAFDPARPWSLTALIAPALMFVLLRFGTGVPPLEAAMLASKGEAYRRYQARVSPFLPRPPRARPG